jgi:hypothetical protein
LANKILCSFIFDQEFVSRNYYSAAYAVKAAGGSTSGSDIHLIFFNFEGGAELGRNLAHMVQQRRGLGGLQRHGLILLVDAARNKTNFIDFAASDAAARQDGVLFFAPERRSIVNEVGERIKDNFSFINFDGLHEVRVMANDEIGAGIHRGVGHFRLVAHELAFPAAKRRDSPVP